MYATASASSLLCTQVASKDLEGTGAPVGHVNVASMWYVGTVAVPGHIFKLDLATLEAVRHANRGRSLGASVFRRSAGTASLQNFLQEKLRNASFTGSKCGGNLVDLLTIVGSIVVGYGRGNRLGVDFVLLLWD